MNSNFSASYAVNHVILPSVLAGRLMAAPFVPDLMQVQSVIDQAQLIPVAQAEVKVEPQTAPAIPSPAAKPKIVIPTTKFLDATNAARLEAGLPALTLNTQLSNAAKAKAEDMQVNEYWDHFRPSDGKAAWDFMREENYIYRFAGENLARGFKTAEGITEAWLESPTHRANLLSKNYTDVGFATVMGVNDAGEDVLITVQMFGSR